MVRIHGYVYLILILIASFCLTACSGDDQIAENNLANALDGTEGLLSAATWGTNEALPAVWEDRVVWQSSAPSPDDPEIFLSDLSLCNISSGSAMRITSGSLQHNWPDIWENLVVWSAWEDENYEIHLYNISTGEEQRITIDSTNQVKPKIWKDYIVWQQGEDSDSETAVFLYDIPTGITTQLDAGSGYAMSPAIWEDRIVWQDGRNGNDFDIYLFTITTGDETQITFDPASQLNPSIWGDNVVWEDPRSSYSHIYLYDLISGNETQITDGEGNQVTPVISENYLVYINASSVCIRNLSTMEERQISSDETEAYKFAPDVWDNRIVWTDSRNGDYDIYLYTVGISLPQLSAGFTENITQGLFPLTVQFTDTSSGQVEGWHWNFGDETTSDEQNPVHTYSNPGSFSVILTVYNHWQTDAIQKPELVSVGTTPVPQFSTNISSGPAPVAIMFNDESSGFPLQWHWDFGDGAGSDEQNPVHVYERAGIYDINLTVTNIYGTAVLVKNSFITIMDASYHSCLLPSDGITIGEKENGTSVMIEKGNESQYQVHLLENNSVVQYVVGEDKGIEQVWFYSNEQGGFSLTGNHTVEGVLSGICVESSDILPTFVQGNLDNCSLNFTFTMADYPPDGRIQVAIWEGCTPDDLTAFKNAAVRSHYDAVEEVAYSFRFQEENNTTVGPVSLIFGLSSDWVSTNGWGDHQTLKIESEPGGARVYVDGNYVGFSPIAVTGLAPGQHTVRLMKRGYYDYALTMEVRDERDSIHVIRICDDGTGEVLNTTFIGHDSERNLDFFRVESPDGLSTFGLASLSSPGNFFQMLYLIISTAVSGGGGSGGGGGGGGDVAGPAATSTIIPTVTGTPLQNPIPTQATAGGDVDEAPGTGTQSAASTGQAEETTLLSGGDQGETMTGALTQGTSTIVLLKNLSVVFVVVLVTLVFYLRWNKREQ